jgi:acetyl esterase/lipase
MYADVDEFPSYMMFVTCDGDELCLEAEAHAKKLDTGSRVVTHTRVEDVRHGFDKVCQPGSREEKLRDEVYASVASTIEDIASVS